jgi:glycerate 2-kinase
LKIIIAPQAFKECAPAYVIASTIAAGIHRALPTAQLVLAPVADGGDGTLDILLAAKSGERHLSQCIGANNENKWVLWGVLTNAFPKTAIIETARVCGLADINTKKNNPSLTTTYGVGMLIQAALEKGFRRLFIGLGGSATNDAGTGLAQALGVRFLDKKGKELPKGGAALKHLHAIDASRLHPLLKETKIIAGCDVNNPIIGPNGASHVFSPQKGASKAMADKLESALTHFVEVVKRELGQDISQRPFLGAAGGMAAGLFLFCGAETVSGAEWILNEIGFQKILEDADLVVTGEGRIDFQTASLKAPLAVAKAAKLRKIPVIAIGGAIGSGAEILKEKGIDAIFAASPNAAEIPSNALQLLEKTAEKALTDFLKLTN